jgi:ABC-type multidrug transport system ATPase subunit
MLWMKNQYPETAIVMITQKIEEVEEFADRLAIINDGQIVESGTLAEIKQRYDCNQYILKITPSLDDEDDHAVSQSRH